MSLPEPDAFADMVVSTVKSAIGPLLERLAAAEARIATAGAVDASIAMLRDRVVALETKTAIPPPADPALGDLRDRVIVVETKALHPPDLSGLAEIAGRVAALESRPLPVPPVAEKAVDLAPVLDRLSKLEMRGAETTPILAAVADVTKDLGAMRERIAVVEVRAQVPGPAGKDGANGKDGADGFGLEDFSADFDGDRTVLLKFARGAVVKTFPLALPFQRYQGVYQEGKGYALGDTVTWAGSTWHCQDATTTKPGEGSKAWTLIVKRGRDGKDGENGKDGKPGRDLTKEDAWRSSP